MLDQLGGADGVGVGAAVVDCPAPDCCDSERRQHVTSDEAIDLLLSWANRISDLADDMEDLGIFDVRKQDDLRSGIQERAQCMIDLLCLLSGREVSSDHNAALSNLHPERTPECLTT